MPHLDLQKLPAGWRGRLLALGLLSIVVLIAFLIVILPVADLWRALDEEEQILQTKASGYRRLIARQGDIARQLDERQAELATTSDFLIETDPALAAAQAQRDLGVRAETTGVDVLTTLALPPTSADGFASIGFQMSVSGSLRSLRDFIYAIEAGQPRLIIDHLLLRPAAATDTVAGDPAYDMMLELHGYMQERATP